MNNILSAHRLVPNDFDNARTRSCSRGDWRLFFCFISAGIAVREIDLEVRLSPRAVLSKDSSSNA
jgi:hypothetical protein